MRAPCGNPPRDRRRIAECNKKTVKANMSNKNVQRLLMLAVLTAAVLAAAAARAESPAEHGKYLVGIMDCTGCHTTGALAGQPDATHFLAGSDVGFQIPGLGIFYPPNLTSDRKTGLGEWSEQDIVTVLRTGVRPDGRELAPAMPWRSYAKLSDQDVQAVAAYLKSLPAVDHAVPAPTGPSEKAPGPYFTVAMPD
jgi:mono/diheme cytochrome c family protein